MDMVVESRTEVPLWPAAAKAGWSPADIQVDRLTHQVTQAERDTMMDIAASWNATGRPVTAMTKADFSDPVLDVPLARLCAILRSGPGLVFLSGLPHDQEEEQIRTIYWGLGTHFGRGVSQNHRGEMIGEVKVRTDVVERRAYGHSGKLILHTDRIDILSLFCVGKPRSGGSNTFISGLAVWDIVARERPDLIPIFKRGFHQNRLSENAVPGEESTPYPVPVFGQENGLRSVLFSGNAHIDHQRHFFADRLAPEDEDALDYLAGVRDRPGLALSHMLERGETVFINNHEVLHSREAFEDGDTPSEKRRLLRLWLQGEPVRPKPEAMTVMHNPSGLQGIDPAPSADPMAR